MLKTIIISLIILLIGIIMTMSGRGGGNFYVPILIIAGLGMHQAAAMGQFILLIAAFTGTLMFHKHKLVDWKLALIIDPPTDIMAFVGGYFSSYLSGIHLKIILSIFLIFAGFFMMIKIKDRPIQWQKKIGFWHRNFAGEEYVVNLWYTIPITALAGLIAGAVGISCGSFKIPLMVILCGVPMQIAVGTSSAMVASTAVMGFFGHTIRGHFEPHFAIPLAIAAILSGIIGGRLAIKTKPEYLKTLFALTTFIAAIMVIINTFISK